LQKSLNEIYIFNSDTLQFEYVNDAALSNLGYSLPEIKQLTPLSIKPEYTLAKFKELIKPLINNENENIFFETIHKRKDGSRYPVEVHLQYVSEVAHSVFLAFILDITARKESEKKLKEIEANYRNVVENIHEALLIEDNAGNLISANKGFRNIFGYTDDDELKLTFNDYTASNSLDEVRERHDMRMKGVKVAEEFEYLGKCKDGSEIWIDCRVTPLFSDGRIIGTQSLARDITDRKKAEAEIKVSEERFRTIYEENPLMNFTLDENGKILSLNNRGATDLGYQSDELIGHSVLDVFYQEDHQAVLNQIKECILNLRKSFSWEMRKVTKGGNTIWVAETGTALVDVNGNYLVMIVCENITNRKKAEQEIIQKNEQLRNLASHLENIREEERTHMAREIHDELGQQLTGIHMNLAIISQDIESLKTVPSKRIVEVIHMVDNTFGTVRKISSSLRPSELDDLGLLAAMESYCHEFERTYGIACNCNCNSSIADQPFEKSFATGIFRIYQETLTNIARHSKATCIECNLKQEGNQLILSVRDNGSGFKIENVQNKSLGITGMKERAIMIGGKLTIESEEGTGTHIILTVPILIRSNA
jgi:PAS domain S-box-containing protein